MKVKDILEVVGGRIKINIYGTTEKDKYVTVWKGIGDDIKFPLVPYADYEVEHVSIVEGEDILGIVIDSSINFADINPETIGLTAYINNDISNLEFSK
jgi:hypothetical protein